MLFQFVVFLSNICWSETPSPIQPVVFVWMWTSSCCLSWLGFFSPGWPHLFLISLIHWALLMWRKSEMLKKVEEYVLWNHVVLIHNLRLRFQRSVDHFEIIDASNLTTRHIRVWFGRFIFLKFFLKLAQLNKIQNILLIESNQQDFFFRVLFLVFAFNYCARKV